jgi:hypothetical protein
MELLIIVGLAGLSCAIGMIMDMCFNVKNVVLYWLLGSFFGLLMGSLIN